MASRGQTRLRAFLPQSAPRDACSTAPWRLARGRRGLAASSAHVKAKASTEGESRADPRLPPPLGVAALRNLALLCGCNASGTRAALRAGLAAALDEDAAPSAPAEKTAPPRRILSIDMGVRNLAYCLLHVDGAAGRPGRRPVPTLVAWERLSLVDDRESAAGQDASPRKPPASAFSPPVLAAAAARLVRDRLLPAAPTHVLIERQRFRSGGGAAVLEWTVRVNSLEAMLHGILAYQKLEPGDGDGARAGSTIQAVHAVSPQRASQFLLRGGIGGAGSSSSSSSSSEKAGPSPSKKPKEKDIKAVKEAFVAGALRAPGLLLAYDAKLGGMVDAFLLRWDAKQTRGRRKGRTEATDEAQLSLTKIDDLADCVAQALVWLEWDDNTAVLREQGAEALLATKRLGG